MRFIFVGVSIIAFFAATITLGPSEVNGWLKAAVIVPLLFLVIFSLAKLKPKEEETDQETVQQGGA